MRMSKMGVKPEKQAPKDAEAVNHRLLIQAGFVYQEMAGVYTFLPLGLRVINKIENIIRRHMDLVASEVLMSTLAPVDLWEKTGRIGTVDVLMKTTPANEVSRAKNDSEYIVSPTHEEVITPIAARFNSSYKDFPVAYYQFQTKFRNEPRAKNGLLRGREFRMKDLYSFHTTQEDFENYYEKVKDVYLEIYKELGLGADTMVVKAAGGDFTATYTHEFQTRLETGEDTIYKNKITGEAFNKEVAPEDAGNEDIYEVFKASEVGNIFPLGTKYSSALGYEFTDTDGQQKPVIMGSYGIGISRLMGVMVEKFNDEKGIIWPEAVAPFKVSLISFEDTKKEAEDLYNELINKGIETLWDDRDLSAGVKFADADLIGNPYRAVISKRSLEAGGVEVKKRNETQATIMKVGDLLDLMIR